MIPSNLTTTLFGTVRYVHDIPLSYIFILYFAAFAGTFIIAYICDLSYEDETSKPKTINVAKKEPIAKTRSLERPYLAVRFCEVSGSGVGHFKQYENAVEFMHRKAKEEKTRAQRGRSMMRQEKARLLQEVRNLDFEHVLVGGSCIDDLLQEMSVDTDEIIYESDFE